MKRLVIRAALLCLVAGYVDAIGYTELGNVFAANMTGNTVLLAIAAARGEWMRVTAYGFTLTAFFVGAMAASALRRTTGRPAISLFAAAALLLVATFVHVEPNLRLALLATTMGLQAGAITHFGKTQLQTVVITNTLVRLADHLVERFLPVARTGEPGAMWLSGLAWLAYGVGAALAIVAQHLMKRSLLIAALVQLVVAIEMTGEQREAP